MKARIWIQIIVLISGLILFDGCYTTFAVPNQGGQDEFLYAGETDVVSCDSTYGPGLVYREEYAAVDDYDPGVRIIIFQHPSWFVYDDPWDDWYYGYGWFDWYSGGRYPLCYDPWWTPYPFVSMPVYPHYWGWGDFYWAHPWRHHWDYDPWPDYDMPSHHATPIHARVQPERRPFDRRDRTVAARISDRHPENGTSARSTSTQKTPLAKGNRLPEDRNANRRAPVTIRDIRHDEPAARSRTTGSIRQSTNQESKAVSASRPESRRKPVVLQKESGRQTSTQSSEAVGQTTTQPARSVTRTRPSEPVRMENQSRPEPKNSARSTESKPSVQSARSDANFRVSRQNASDTDRRASVSRSSENRSQSSSPKSSGSKRSSDSGSSQRSRR